MQNAVMHANAADQAGQPQTLSIPPGSLVHVYTPGWLTLLAIAGLAIAVIGALGPATWAAASPTTTAHAPNNRSGATPDGQASDRTADHIGC